MTEDTTPPQSGKDVVDRILRDLGGCPVILPIERGRKGPFYDGWQKRTWLETQNPDTPIAFSRVKKDSMNRPEMDEHGHEQREIYRATIYGDLVEESENFGVLLGGASRLKIALDGSEYLLCTIDVDDDIAAEQFLQLNPTLQETLRTRGRRGCNCWVWVDREDCQRQSHKLFRALEGGQPDKKFPWGEWRADGNQTVIHGIHPEGMAYQRIGDGSAPLLISMDEITWPEDLHIPWRKTPLELLVADHGQAFYMSKKGALTLNKPFFVAKYAQDHRILFEPDEGVFYEYNETTGVWEKKSENVIQWEFTADFKVIAEETGELSLITKRDNASMRGLVQQLRGAVEHRDAFRKDHKDAGVVHLLNGMLDLRVEPPELCGFSPEYFSRNQIPVSLDEQAEAKELFEVLLVPAFCEDDIRALQLWAGSLLLGPNLAQRFLIIYGTAGRGKGTFINLMARMSGEENTAELRTENLHERFEMSNYVGRSLLIGSDVPGNFLQQEGAHKIKALVGNDLLTAEFKQGGAQRLRGVFNIAIVCNSRLKIKLDGDAGAYRRRMIPVTSSAPPPDTPDPQLLDRLFESEASAILNWMIAGAIELLRQFREFGAMQLSELHKARIDSLLSESDSVRYFVRACVIQDSAENVTSSELMIGYTQFCEKNAWKPETERRAQSQMIDAIQEIHHTPRANDIKRRDGNGDEKNQKGYRGLTVRLPKVEDQDDAGAQY